MEKLERHERDFKGVWIPRDIWLSKQLSLMAKVLFVEIHSLDNERGCFASNAYFAEFFQVSDRQIRNLIVKNRNERVIRAAGKWRRVSEEERRALGRSHAELIHKMRMPGAHGVGRKLPGR